MTKRNTLIILGFVIAVIVIIELTINTIGGYNTPDLDEQLHEIVTNNEGLSKQIGTFRASNVVISNFLNIEKDTITFNAVFSGNRAKIFLKGRMKKNEDKWKILCLFMIRNANDSVSIPLT
ncbi:hypothetical protein [Runella aurantiaca]|uniref:Uncharacterized protein n=1 Tax=Runella aurantiaca TaxID=2282308 RepID=A0A369I672_9BACT|nr:hypothetical protein [Runella aurantiaca]RDB04542.1 hypothetical protein DVG78_17790 [Runella aurantiaca]